MSEAHQIYDDLLEALSPILPRTVYQDVRRVRTLACAITGLCLTHTVRLGAWAEVVESRVQYAASRVRCLARWLHHPAIRPQEWYQPVLQAALVDWPRGSRLYIALDTTALTPCADPRFPGLLSSSYSSGVASYVPQEHPGRF